MIFSINQYDFLIFILALCVVFVNGWTDAPASVSSCVASGAVSMRKSLLICAIFNFLGVLVVSFVNFSVAENILASAGFGNGITRTCGSCACFVSVCLFGVIAWLFAMPSSESHALIASIGGASLYINGTFASLNKIGGISIAMFVSCVVAFVLSYGVAKICPKNHSYKNLQIFACIGTSFMHGAQDGQKFIGMLLSFSILPMVSQNGNTVFAILIVSVVMALGTLTGGERIIKSLGEKTVSLDMRRGFVSDISATMCLILCSLFGYPVSTGNIKTCSLAGAGLSDKCKVNKRTFFSLISVSIITFPICFLFGYVITGIFMRIL